MFTARGNRRGYVTPCNDNKCPAKKNPEILLPVLSTKNSKEYSGSIKFKGLELEGKYKINESEKMNDDKKDEKNNDSNNDSKKDEKMNDDEKIKDLHEKVFQHPFFYGQK